MIMHVSKADNTVREAKNQNLLRWLHLQVQRGRFRTGTLACPRKSHSHDRIGLQQIVFWFHAKFECALIVI